MNRDILQAFQTGSALGGAFQNLDQYEHERAVKSRMDELLGAAGQHGGDITMLDASQYADRAGLEAMGRLAAQYSQTEQGKANIMRNNVIQAKHRYGMMQQYLKDVDDAVKSGDQQRVVGLLSNAGSLGGVPYRFTPTEDGRIAVSYIDPDGVHDKGTMTMMEAFEELKARMATKGRFIRDSVMFGMGVQEENMARMMNPGSWKTVTDARGNQYTMIPQVFQRNGQYESGFMVSGPGVHGNMTLEEVQRRGLMAAPAGGLGGTTLGKDDQKIIDAASTVVNPETGEKVRDPYMAQALTMLTQQVGSADKAMIALQEWERMLSQDEKIAEQLASLPAGQKAMAIIEIMQAQAKAPAPAAEPKKPAPQKVGGRESLHAGIREAAAGKGGSPKNDRVAAMPAYQSGSFGLYDWNQ